MAPARPRHPVTSPIGSAALVNRRVVLKASAIMSAMAASVVAGLVAPQRSRAQESGATYAVDWYESEQRGEVSIASEGDYFTFATDFPFTAVGGHWSGDEGVWPILEIQVSDDGEIWSDIYTLTANEDVGRPTRDNRIFTSLLCSGGGSYIRYRITNQNGEPVEVPGFGLTYINSADGPTVDDVTQVSLASTDPGVPPPIVSRAAWGADEDLRFVNGMETWPTEYATVEHVLVHHTETSNVQDPVQAIRSVYYYHAITKGWGDIGYNYLVDRFGTLYEGRIGGQNVIGCHAYQYQVGSAAVSFLGNFGLQDISEDAQAAAVALIAWVARDLDPLGTADFHETPNAPTILAHRDVSDSDCPGNFLYQDIPEIRLLVAEVIDDQPDGPPAGLRIGDVVAVQTDNGDPLNIRQNPGESSAAAGQVADGTIGVLLDGPEFAEDKYWYLMNTDTIDGWAFADFLVLAPPDPSSTGEFSIDDTIAVATASTKMRAQPRLIADVVTTMTSGMQAQILVGPRFRDGIVWYQILMLSGIEDIGWINQADFDLITDVPPAPVVKFQVGDAVITSSSVNFREGPATYETVITQLPAGTTGTVLNGPTIAQYQWYQLQTAYGVGWSVQDYLELNDGNPTPGFELGDYVKTTSSVNFRSGPGTNNSILKVLSGGAIGTVLGGPQQGSGYDWYSATFDGQDGWVASQFLAASADPTPPPPDAVFEVGDSVKTTSSVNFRSGPGTGNSILTVLDGGDIGTILGGPQQGSGYDWYNSTFNGQDGWVASQFLAASADPPPPPPDAEFEVDDVVETTSSLNLRTGAGTNKSIIALMAGGTIGTVLDGPVAANGYNWYQLDTTYGEGWAVSQYLQLSNGEPPATIEIGGTVVVSDGPLNLRSSAGTGASIVAVLVTGANGTVLDGPQGANGYSWWQLQTPQGTGWAASDFLAAT